MLINPLFDASEREIYARSGYLSSGKTMVAYLSGGNQLSENDKKVFRPEKFGEYTKDYMGNVYQIGSESRKP